MKILVTGINGLVGRAIARLLKDKEGNWVIIGIGRKKKCIHANVSQYLCADISSSSFVVSIKKAIEECDVIVHAAACIEEESAMFPTNVEGTFHVLEAAIKLNCKKIIYLSSIPVIGTPQRLPITEEHPIFPQTLYHCTKYFGEQLIALPQFSSIDRIIFRIPAPVGPWMPRQRMISVFLSACKKNLPLFLHGEGKRIQNYIDVRDIGRAIFSVIKKDVLDGIYLIVGGSYSNREIAEACIKITDSKSVIVRSGVPDLQEKVFWLISGQKAKIFIGYEPFYSIQETLGDVWEKCADTYGGL